MWLPNVANFGRQIILIVPNTSSQSVSTKKTASAIANSLKDHQRIMLSNSFMDLPMSVSLSLSVCLSVCLSLCLYLISFLPSYRMVPVGHHQHLEPVPYPDRLLHVVSHPPDRITTAAVFVRIDLHQAAYSRVIVRRSGVLREPGTGAEESREQKQETQDNHTSSARFHIHTDRRMFCFCL